jgi:hypothetical protein
MMAEYSASPQDRNERGVMDSPALLRGPYDEGVKLRLLGTLPNNNCCEDCALLIFYMSSSYQR